MSETIIGTLSVAIAAFAVWLTVRIVNRRERWAIRLAITIGASLPFIYLLSFGPACWIASRRDSTKEVSVVYSSFGRTLASGPIWARRVVRAYAWIGMPGDSEVVFPSAPRITLIGPQGMTSFDVIKEIIWDDTEYITESTYPGAILLLTPPTWAVIGFLIGVLVDRRDRRRLVNPPAPNPDAPAETD
jgi:hypothetical protein